MDKRWPRDATTGIRQRDHTCQLLPRDNNCGDRPGNQQGHDTNSRKRILEPVLVRADRSQRKGQRYLDHHLDMLRFDVSLHIAADPEPIVAVNFTLYGFDAFLTMRDRIRLLGFPELKPEIDW